MDAVIDRRRTAHIATLGELIAAYEVVSEVLRGKRSLNLRQVRALAQRFSLPMEAFV